MARSLAVLAVLAAAVAVSSAAGDRARKYEQLSSTCKNAKAVSGKLPVGSLAECEAKCDAQAAAAPGTGQASCIAVDTDGKANCFLKSECGGAPGHCEGSECGYRVVGVGPSPAPGPPAPPAPPVPPAPPGVTLRQAADKHGIFIGAATNVAGVTSTTEPQYKAVEQAQFSLTTAENACKVGPIHPERNKYSWEGCDTIFAQAKAANQSVRGHNLCWHNENPTWLTSGNFSSSELSQILVQHIDTVVKHYGTRAYCWDVVNEALDANGLKTSSPWYPALPSYIDIAFHAARKAGGPDVKLFYNDYSAEGMNAKSEQVQNMICYERNTTILRHLPLKTDHLPSQAPDNFQENSNNSKQHRVFGRFTSWSRGCRRARFL